MKTRKEFDSIGGINVPSDKYWGASTQRSKKFFNIGKILINDDYPYAIIKVKNEKFDFNKTFNCGSAKVRVHKPDWL